MSTIPGWRLVGDWFDICSCNIPCPCEFAQAPTNNACQGMLAWHIREGHYGTFGLTASTSSRLPLSKETCGGRRQSPDGLLHR